MNHHKLVKKIYKTLNLCDKKSQISVKSHKKLNLRDKKSPHSENMSQNCKYL